MKTALAVIVAETNAPNVAAVFNREDPAELFKVETMQRFHASGLYRAHAIKRTKAVTGSIVVELASFNPRNRAQSHVLDFLGGRWSRHQVQRLRGDARSAGRV